MEGGMGNKELGKIQEPGMKESHEFLFQYFSGGALAHCCTRDMRQFPLYCTCTCA